MKDKPLGVYVVGSLNMDSVFSVPSLTSGTRNQGQGSFDELPGGIGANHAVAIHRMSHFKSTPQETNDTSFPFQVSVSIIGKIGDTDKYGATIKKELENNQVNIRAVGTAQGHRTGTAYVQIDPKGLSQIINHPNANGELSPADIKAWLPASNIEMVVVSLEIPTDTACKAIEMARKQGVPVILNLTPQPTHELLGNSTLFHVDHLIMNDKDVDSILGLSPISDQARRDRFTLQKRYGEASTRFHTKGASCVVITLGDKGVLASHLDSPNDNGEKCRKLWLYDALQGPNGVKDSTCASDAFVGAYAVEILRQLHETHTTRLCRVDISSALDMGIRAGGFPVGVLGSMDGCPWRDHIVGHTAGPFMPVPFVQG